MMMIDSIAPYIYALSDLYTFLPVSFNEADVVWWLDLVCDLPAERSEVQISLKPACGSFEQLI